MSKTPKRPRDANQLAKAIVDIATDSDDKVVKILTEKQKLAQKGGLAGGNARKNALSPERRREIAKAAAKVRWANGDDSSSS